MATDSQIDKRRGRLVLVVGPSGVGKDSLLDAARAALKNDPAAGPGVVFPRRVVTRAPGLPGEDYIAMSEADFAAAQARGDFALHWPAHGLHYGIPKQIEADLAAGREVVVNVSRTVLDDARKRYPGLLVLLINASPAILRQRLLGRGRESPPEIEDRLQRAAAFTLSGSDVVRLDNDGPLAETAARFVDLLKRRPQ